MVLTLLGEGHWRAFQTPRLSQIITDAKVSRVLLQGAGDFGVQDTEALASPTIAIVVVHFVFIGLEGRAECDPEIVDPETRCTNLFFMLRTKVKGEVQCGGIAAVQHQEERKNPRNQDREPLTVGTRNINAEPSFLMKVYINTGSGSAAV